MALCLVMMVPYNMLDADASFAVVRRCLHLTQAFKLVLCVHGGAGLSCSHCTVLLAL